MRAKRYHEPCMRAGCKDAADARCTFQALGVNVYFCVMHAPLMKRRERDVRIRAHSRYGSR